MPVQRLVQLWHRVDGVVIRSTDAATDSFLFIAPPIPPPKKKAGATAGTIVAWSRSLFPIDTET